MADAFDADDSDHDDDDEIDDRQRLMRAQPDQTESADEHARRGVQRQVTQLPVFTPPPTSGRVYGGGRDAVFANMSAKPGQGEEADEKPPVSCIA